MFGKNNGNCKHKWVNKGTMVIKREITNKDGETSIEEYPRLVRECKKCGVNIHVPIYSLKQLSDIENEPGY